MIARGNMTRTQIAFRLDPEKAEQFKRKIISEGRNQNAVLEGLIDNYLAEGSSEVAPVNNEEESAIAELTDKITQLEKQLAPVSELLSVTATDKLASGSNKVRETKALASSSRGGFGFAVSTLLADNSNEVRETKVSASGNNEVASGNNEVADVNSEIADVNSEVADVSNEIADVNSEVAENPPTEIGLEATEEDSEGQSILEDKEGNTAQNKGDSENDTQKSDDEGDSASAIAEFLTKGLNQQKLADRLKVVPGTVDNNKKKGNEHFKQWSKKRDPNKIEWYLEDKTFYPVK
jgi:hypothetical protein